MKASDAKKFVGKVVEYMPRSGYTRYGAVVGTSGRNIQLETDWLLAPDIVWMKLLNEKEDGKS